MLVEQAVFSCALGDRRAGYRLLGVSGGISLADARELDAWGPGAKSLRSVELDATSINFHPLRSGQFCISRTVAAGPEYILGAQRIYTQCLVLPSESLRLFANNPFNVLKAAHAARALLVHDEVPEHLDSPRLDAIGTAVDRPLLAQLATQPGPTVIARLVEASLGRAQLGVSGPVDPADCFAGLINCLPVACRTEFSFSTGLRFSPRRPFRVIAVDDDSVQQQWLARQHALAVFNLGSGETRACQPLQGGWARFLSGALAGGRTALLAAELSQPSPALGAAGLNDLGERLCSKLTADDTLSEAEPWGHSLDAAAHPNGETETATEAISAPSVTQGSHPELNERSPAPTEAGAVTSCHSTPSAVNEAPPESQELVPEQELLEHLDDVVYGAINGRAASLAELEIVWPAVKQIVCPDRLEESREQYLRSALAVWTDYLGDTRNDATRATAALDVLCVIFD